MKILLINPPYSNEERYGKDMARFGPCNEPLGLAYLAGALEKAGHDVKIWDGTVQFRGLAFLGFTNVADLIGITILTPTYNIARKLIKTIKQYRPNVPIVVGGPHPTILPEETLRDIPEIDYIVMREGEYGLLYLVAHLKDIEKGAFIPCMTSSDNLDDLPLPARHLLPMHLYKMTRSRRQQGHAYTVIVARGCPYKCLAGDTLINTIEGKRKIQALVGKHPLVLTRNPNSKKVVYIKPKAIFKTKRDAELVRVNFTDGSYIDCTPDHRFMALQYKNQFQPRKEWEIEAKDLKPNQSVVACKYPEQLRESRPMMERLLGRKLKKGEVVHHSDKSRKNYDFNNLKLLPNPKNHILQHPEVSLRMKQNNPAKKMTAEWKENVKKAITGISRNYQQRLRYRKSKLGKKNPNYKHGNRMGVKSRLGIINHKVAKVEWLPILKDTYCMEIPGYDWFFANDVLVHNCAFCCRIHGRKVRYHSVERVIEEINILVEKYNAKEINLEADTITNSRTFISALCGGLIAYGLNREIRWTCESRVDTVDEEMLADMKRAGCWQISYGVESGSQRLLDFIQKGIKLQQVEETFRITKKVGINIRAFYMLGIPTETREESLETIEFAKKLMADWSQFTLCTPFPGTELHRWCQEHSEALSSDWSAYKTHGGWAGGKLAYVPLGRNEEEMKALQRMAYRKVYLRPRVIWRFLKGVRSWGQVREYLAGFWMLVKR